MEESHHLRAHRIHDEACNTKDLVLSRNVCLSSAPLGWPPAMRTWCRLGNINLRSHATTAVCRITSKGC